jgi:hypothetical protein
MATLTKSAPTSQSGAAMSNDHFDLTPMFEQTNCLNEDTTNSHANILKVSQHILNNNKTTTTVSKTIPPSYVYVFFPVGRTRHS